MPTPIIPTEAPRPRRRGIPIFRPNVNSLAFQPIVNIPDEGESNLWQPQPKPTSSNLRIYTGPVVFSFNSKNPRKQKTTSKTKKYATKKRKIAKKKS